MILEILFLRFRKNISFIPHYLKNTTNYKNIKILNLDKKRFLIQKIEKMH
jgi:hypothetical protein